MPEVEDEEVEEEMDDEEMDGEEVSDEEGEEDDEDEDEEESDDESEQSGGDFLKVCAGHLDIDCWFIPGISMFQIPPSFVRGAFGNIHQNIYNAWDQLLIDP